jgi:hypothetical protein
MPTKLRTPRTPEEVARIQAQLQELADNPQRIARMRGRRELAALRALPRDSRRPTDGRSRPDNRTYWRDSDANHAAGLL